MAVRKSIDEILRRFLEDKLEIIKREYMPTELVVFGSRAKGTAGPDSDIDLIVVSRRFADIPFQDRAGHFLNTIWPDIHVDVFCYTPDEFDDMMCYQAPFVREAVTSGIRVE